VSEFEKTSTRVAVVGSPRSGNSWIRSTIAGTLGWPEFAVHNYLDVPPVLPEKCFLQIHWYREPNFQRWLRDHNFVVMTVARHPLDTLLSALHYINFESQTCRWLEGNANLPGNLTGVSPCSQEFLDYALSVGAEDFLSITYQWWNDESSIRLRYEDAVRNPEIVLGREVARLGGTPQKLNEWLERLSMKNMQATHNRHGWRGEPGLWRQLLTPAVANAIYKRHKRVFETLGYTIGHYWLSRSAAVRNWNALK